MITKSEIDKLSYRIIGAAIEVHRNLGPGLLEHIYQKCLRREFDLRNLKYLQELVVPVEYKNIYCEVELRCDFLVEDQIIVELKSVEEIAPVFEAQLLTYMRLLKKPKGILINFNCANLFKEGQRTFVNEFYRALDNTPM